MRSLINPLDWPIATKLIVAFLFVALVPLAVVGLTSTTQARQGLLNAAELNLINTAKRTSGSVDDYISNRRSDVQQIATDESVINFLTADRSTLDLRSNRDALAARRLLVSKKNALVATSYFFIARVDPKDPTLNGQVELTSYTERDEEGAVPPGELRNVVDQTYFKEALKGFYYISDPQLTDFSDANVEAVMYYSVPVRDTKGNLVGVAVGRSSMFEIWQLVNGDQEVAGSGSFGMLVDNTSGLGIRIADSRIKDKPADRTKYIFSIMRTLTTNIGQPNSRGQYLDSKRFPDNFDFGKAQQPLPNIYESAQAEYNRDRPFFSTALGEDEARVGYAELSVKPSWYYYVVVPQATYAAAANAITTFTVIVLVVAIVLVALLAVILARILTIPVRRISRVLTRIGIGDFDARVNVNSRDELGRLGESLNAMFDNTLTLIQTREEKEELQERITHLLQEISTVAEGDLTAEAEVTADITGAIADSFNLMIEELRKVILNIQQAASQASTYFDQMVYNTQRTDEAANRQAARILNVTSAIEDINRSIQQVSENATVSSQVAQEARDNAHQGGLAVTKSVASMNRIRGNVQETAKKIKRLGESSQQIGEIVKLIDDIADQTNMLALNAAIQAAMAGEQGKGFSVVAEEVRRLAERSAGATREIAGLVKSIQDDTAEAVVAMEESTREVVEGSKVADEAGRALGSIESVVDRLADLIFSISQVTQQQAGTSASIAQSMTEISSLTMEASALRQESASAVEKLAQIVQDLNSSVSTFRVVPSESAPTPAALAESNPPASWQGTVSGEPPFPSEPDFVFAEAQERTPAAFNYSSYEAPPPANNVPPVAPAAYSDYNTVPQSYQDYPAYNNPPAAPTPPSSAYPSFEERTPPPPSSGYPSYQPRPGTPPPPPPPSYPDYSSYDGRGTTTPPPGYSDYPSYDPPKPNGPVPPSSGYPEPPKPASQGYPEFYYSGTPTPPPAGQNGRGAADGGESKPPKAQSDEDFDLEAMLAEDADFFESIFNDTKTNGGHPGDGRPPRPSGPGTNN